MSQMLIGFKFVSSILVILINSEYVAIMLEMLIVKFVTFATFEALSIFNIVTDMLD